MKDDEEGKRQEGLMDRSGGVCSGGAKEARNGMNCSHDGLHWPSSADSWPLCLVGQGIAQGVTLDLSKNA